MEIIYEQLYTELITFKFDFILRQQIHRFLYIYWCLPVCFICIFLVANNYNFYFIEYLYITTIEIDDFFFAWSMLFNLIHFLDSISAFFYILDEMNLFDETGFLVVSETTVTTIPMSKISTITMTIPMSMRYWY